MMKRQLLLAGAAIAAVGAAVVFLLAVRGESDTVSAADIVQRATAARSDLAHTIGPNTTLHMVQHRYSPSTPPRGSAPFVYPVNATLDEYIVFGSDGKQSALRTVATDDATGEIFAVTEMVGGQVVDTDMVTGATYNEGNFSRVTTSDISASIGASESDAGALVNSAQSPPSALVDGVNTYVIERAGADGKVVSRTYIDKSTYREVKWESFAADGSVSKSLEVPVFEILPGAILPTPAAAVVTAIIEAQTVAAATPTPFEGTRVTPIIVTPTP